jgi:hypothetical protein
MSNENRKLKAKVVPIFHKIKGKYRKGMDLQNVIANGGYILFAM